MTGKKQTKEISLEDLLEAKDFDAKIAKLSYEEALTLTEELLESVEAGELPLEQAILSYEKGMALVKHLRGVLDSAEKRLKVLKETEEGIKIEEE